ncbi:MAG: hypothetical protein MMC33_001856 [Icmadophila ericetorum]|nr:hypothetical protein [Icmadophila ericetorum]
MSSPSVTEGEAVFDVPQAGKPCKTWYEIHGDVTPRSGICPLVLIHGGPGIPSNYMIPITELASLRDIPVVRYDQVGCGKSTRLSEKMGDVSFWTVDLFLDELDNLLRHLDIQDNYCLLGQSWGGMLLSCHAVRQPKDLKKAIISNSPTDIATSYAITTGCARHVE